MTQSFLPNSIPEIEYGTGNPNADIIIIGDFADNYARKNSKPIAGPVETVLEECLHQAGLTKSEVYMMNLMYDIHKQSSGKYWNTRTKKVVANIDGYINTAKKVIENIKPKVIVTLGEISAYVFTENGSVAKTRGYPFLYNNIVVIPCLHPRDMIWGNYIWRYYLSHDLTKASKISDSILQAHSPTITPCIPDTFEEAKAQLDHIEKYDILSVDIEVTNYEVSCIGFAISNTIAYSIPFDMRWELKQEVELWNRVARILESERIAKIGQNFIFDIHFLAYRMGIRVRGPIIDTMMAHSIMYPDFLKGLNFLASIYTTQPYWKDMVKFKDIKKES